MYCKSASICLKFKINLNKINTKNPSKIPNPKRVKYDFTG